MFLYLNYAAVYPYTGGEIVYLSEITSGGERRNICAKIIGDGLMPYVAISILFVGLFNSSTNAMQIGRMIVMTVQPSQKVDGNTACFIGIIVLSAICLLQWIWPQGARRFNQLEAACKIGFLIILLGFAINSASQKSYTGDFGHTAKALSYENWTRALLAVIFSFEGWENATFVAGEIDPRTLRSGFMWAVGIVSLLYTSIVIAFLFTVTDGKPSCTNSALYPAAFSNCSQSAEKFWVAVAIISAFGNINSIVYTFSKVKQAIGDAQVLPWSHLWRWEHEVFPPTQRTPRNPAVDKGSGIAPLGGLLLHWIVSTIMIAGVSSMPDFSESIMIPGFIQAYTHAFILFTLAALSWRLPSRYANTITIHENGQVMQDVSQGNLLYPKGCFGTCLVVVFTVLYLAVNGFIIGWTPKSNLEHFSGENYPTITMGLFALALAYYLLIFGSARYSTRSTAPNSTQPSNHNNLLQISEQPGIWGQEKSILTLAHIEVTEIKDAYFDERLRRVKRFGRRWRLQYRLQPSYRQAIDGRNDGNFGTPVGNPINFLYWLFGGRRWLIDTPPEQFSEKFRQWIKQVLNKQEIAEVARD